MINCMSSGIEREREREGEKRRRRKSEIEKTMLHKIGLALVQT